MLTLSRRARELGTENAFVVLGEVERLQAEGRSILSFCIGQPDFRSAWRESSSDPLGPPGWPAAIP